jgi:hypothetical protein
MRTGFGLDITRRGQILFETNSILILRRRDTIKPPKKEEINKPYEKRKKKLSSRDVLHDGQGVTIHGG